MDTANEDDEWIFQQQLLASSLAMNTQSFALLAAPSHPDGIRPVPFSAEHEQAEPAIDPIAEAGWLAAADAILMGGLLGEW